MYQSASSLLVKQCEEEWVSLTCGRKLGVLFTHLCRETTEEGKPEMHEGECEVLVEEIA